MKCGIYFAYDYDSITKINDFRQAMIENVSGLPSINGKMDPHITLGVFKDNDFDEVAKNFKLLSFKFNSFSVDLAYIDIFEKQKVIFARPLFNDQLREAHQYFTNIFSSSDIMFNCRTGNWLPHCTLIKRIKTEETFKEAKEFAVSKWESITVKIVKIELIDIFKPLDILLSRKLF